MKLRKYDNKLVRIKCIDGNEYEGLCCHNSADYDYHEFGRDEDSLQMVCFIFYKSDIIDIKIIDKFSDKYGTLEKEIYESGIDFIDEVFESEEDEHIIRLLLYIKDLDDIKDKEELNKLLEKLVKYNDNERIVELAKELLK